MKFHASKKHMIDMLFPIALFFVFAASALMVIVLSANIYENTTEQSHRNHQSRIAISYISEKIHQNDVENSISIGTLDGCEALILKQTYGHETYYTYIYFYDQSLRELFVKDGTKISLSDGKVIFPLQAFTLEEVEEGLIYCSCTDTQNQTVTSYVSIHSQKE